ncbi:TIGR03086 family metal-binding protein [Nocardia sp. NPDC051756]|uniref:TIGR03086 family metal-binding protein n=1 Tax=Nocardia sp. NPDC051756 TaxID=3154751 RepID=UPI0034360F2A
MNITTPAIVDRIDFALTMTGAIVAGITEPDLAEPSLCAGWDLRTELNHLVGGMRIFAAELTHTDPGGAHHDDWLGANPQAAFTTAATLDRAAWHRPDALDTTIRLGFGPVPGPLGALIHLTEVLVHGIDLAVTTNQQHLIDEPASAHLLTTVRAMDFDTFRRPGLFDPQHPAPANAAVHQQLLAFMGRSHVD